jgi:hypothetical protein
MQVSDNGCGARTAGARAVAYRWLGPRRSQVISPETARSVPLGLLRVVAEQSRFFDKELMPAKRFTVHRLR